ncbi:hypothetical protein PMAYCL1PPCAC_06010, partial [Pristionchus mayeri]
GCMLRRPLATVLSSVSIRSLLSTRLYCAPSTSSADDDITTVRTTGVRWAGKEASCNGIYWGQGDLRNTLSRRNHDHTPLQGVMLRSIVMALEQAKKDGLKRVRIQTDFKFLKEKNYRKQMLKFKEQNFAIYNSKDLMENAELFDRILQLMDEMEVTLEYRSAWLENRTGNAVLELLKTGYMKYPPKVDFMSPDYDCDWTITPSFPSSDGRPIPTVYVAGRFEVAYSGFAKAACASLWVPESIEHLEVKQRPIGLIQNLCMYPVTHFRAQLMAIHDAIKEAAALGIPEIRVITDSLHFMHFYKIDWKKRDGSPVANEKFYLKIKALTETVKVHFKGVNHTVESDDSFVNRVQEMANEGLGFPRQHRDTKEYGMSVDELLVGRDAVYSVEGTSTRRVRIFKASTVCKSGVMWDRMDDVPLEEGEVKAAGECMEDVNRRTPAEIMHSVMEHADRMGFEDMVIRTNNRYFVRNVLGFLEVWHRNDWVNARWAPTIQQEWWKRIYELTQRIEVIWDLVEEVDEVKDEIYLSKYRRRKYEKRKKAGRPKKKEKGLPPTVD